MYLATLHIDGGDYVVHITDQHALDGLVIACLERGIGVSYVLDQS